MGQLATRRMRLALPTGRHARTARGTTQTANSHVMTAAGQYIGLWMWPRANSTTKPHDAATVTRATPDSTTANTTDARTPGVSCPSSTPQYRNGRRVRVVISRQA